MDDEDKLLYGDEAEVEEQGQEENVAENEVDLEANQNEDADNGLENGQNQEYDTEVQEEIQDQEVEATGEEGEEGEEGEDDDDDSDDDNVQITIDHNKIEEAKTTYQNFGISKSARQLPSEKKGKFSVEDFEKPGAIDGTPAPEFEIESIEDKPWKKPGADISDYFNYGFTEETWGAYCSRQKRMRLNESGAGLPNNPGSMPPGSSRNFEKTHNGGSIPTLGQAPKRHHQPPPDLNSSAKTSSGIAVLTADKREYSKKIFDTIDFSVPPPGLPHHSVPPPNFSAPPPTSEDFEAPPEEQYDYYGGYEPTQESQWVAPPSSYSVPNSGDAPPGETEYYDKRDPWQRNGQRGSRESPGRDRTKRRRSRSRSRDRYRERIDRDRERDRRREGDRDRERDRERDRGDREKDRRREGDRDRERERGDRDRGERSDRDKDRERDKERKRDRSRSRSPRESKSPSSSGHKHKKSKREKRERSEKSDKDIKREIKDEPEEYAE